MNCLDNASGLAIIIVMSVITCLMSLVTGLCWHQNISSIIGFIFFSGVIEAFYFLAFLIKFLEGAWISKPLLNMHVGMDDESNNHDMVNSGLEIPNAGDGHANALHASVDVDMNGASAEDQTE